MDFFILEYSNTSFKIFLREMIDYGSVWLELLIRLCRYLDQFVALIYIKNVFLSQFIFFSNREIKSLAKKNMFRFQRNFFSMIYFINQIFTNRIGFVKCDTEKKKQINILYDKKSASISFVFFIEIGIIRVKERSNEKNKPIY